jgi:hypothetical protein
MTRNDAELARETTYIVTWRGWIIGDSRNFIEGKPTDMSLVDMCKAADHHHGDNVEMTTYTPVDADGDKVYAVYQTTGIPVQYWGPDPEAVDLVKANGTLLGYVRRIQAMWD